MSANCGYSRTSEPVVRRPHAGARLGQRDTPPCDNPQASDGSSKRPISASRTACCIGSRVAPSKVMLLMTERMTTPRQTASQTLRHVQSKQLADFPREGLHASQQRRNLAAPPYRFRRVATVLECVAVTLWRPRRQAAVHPAAAVRHRWRLAWAPVPRPRAASRAAVHGQPALQGVDPPIFSRSAFSRILSPSRARGGKMGF